MPTSGVLLQRIVNRSHGLSSTWGWSIFQILAIVEVEIRYHVHLVLVGIDGHVGERPQYGVMQLFLRLRHITGDVVRLQGIAILVSAARIGTTGGICYITFFHGNLGGYAIKIGDVALGSCYLVIFSAFEHWMIQTLNPLVAKG